MSARTTYIYCIREVGSDFCKIGIATSIERRLSELQTGNPRRLYVSSRIRGNAAVERSLHEQFGARRLCGEWFDDADGMIAAWFKSKSMRFSASSALSVRDISKYRASFKGERPNFSVERVASLLCVSKMVAEELLSRHEEIVH